MSLENLRKSIIAQLQEIEDEALLLKLLNILEGKEHSVEETEIEYGTTSIIEEHKEILDKRIQYYKDNPKDILSWDAVKDSW